MDLFPLPDTLLPWKHADDAAGYTVRIFIIGVMFLALKFIFTKYIFMQHLRRNYFGVSALHFPEIICHSNSAGNTVTSFTLDLLLMSFFVRSSTVTIPAHAKYPVLLFIPNY